MSKEILSSPANDAVGELEQQVSISVCEENVEAVIQYFANYYHKAHREYIQDYFHP